MKLCDSFLFSDNENMLTDQLFRISGLYFFKLLFGSEKFTGLSLNGPLDTNIRIASIKHCFVFRAQKCESKVNDKASVKKILSLQSTFWGDRLSCYVRIS